VTESETILVTNDKARTRTSAAAQNDSDFDATFLAHWQPIYRALVRLVGDPAEAEDLALETFWQLYDRPPTQADRIGG
jgi:DNA-directed RNA polymerase specialized sigma24 family protein